MKKLAIILLALSAMLAGIQLGGWLFGGSVPELEPLSSRQIAQGELIGFSDKANTHAWLGVPFAAAPQGELRWRAPRPAEPWQGALEANEYGVHCMQIGNPSVTFNMLEWGKASGSEDCLRLNIWAPAFANDKLPRGPEKLPVMLWIHGGGNTIGHGASYDGSMLAGTHKVIVVTINYRLGILGWFSHPALQQTAATLEDASGNFGTLDMIQSLRWVQENIASFGGNPNNVTVFGESAGGRDTVSLLVSPLARGLFHRVIIQSGGTNSTTVLEAQNYRDEATKGHKASSKEIMLSLLQSDGKATGRAMGKAAAEAMDAQQATAYLQSKSPMELFSFFSPGGFGMYQSPQLIEDGTVLPATPMADAFLDRDTYNPMPIITGSNRDEAKMFLMNDERMVESKLGLFKTVIDAERYELHNRYRSDVWQAFAVDDLSQRLQHSQGNTVWSYRFDWDEGGTGWLADYSQVMGAAHSLEIPFVFGQYTGLTLPGVFTDDNQQSATTLSRKMMSYWAEFAYNGNPRKGRNGNLPRWAARGAVEKPSLILDSKQDGGLRMGGEAIGIQELKQRLKSDTAFVEPIDRCELYVQMFKGSLVFDRFEYQRLSACEGVDPEQFAPW